jgi:hypothetical protein
VGTTRSLRWPTIFSPVCGKIRSSGGSGHAAATLAKFQVPEAEQRDVVEFVQSLRADIVE